MMYLRYWKPAIDRCLAAVLLLLFSPGMIMLTIMLLLTQGKPVFFHQKRTGKDRRRFTLYKFRTLAGLPHDEISLKGTTYTRLGKPLRKLGLDELPQLVNIIRGEMSFVGPRPLPVEYEDRYSEEQLQRFQLKPGITGFSQVNGRNKTSWADRFALDIWYTNHVSFTLDLRILLRTMLILLVGLKHLNNDEEVMEVFKGTKVV